MRFFFKNLNVFVSISGSWFRCFDAAIVTTSVISEPPCNIFVRFRYFFFKNTVLNCKEAKRKFTNFNCLEPRCSTLCILPFYQTLLVRQQIEKHKQGITKEPIDSNFIRTNQENWVASVVIVSKSYYFQDQKES